MSDIFQDQEVQEEQAGEDLFQETAEEHEQDFGNEEEINVEVDAIKARRARVQSGEEALDEEDFQKSDGSWKYDTSESDCDAYMNLVEQFESIANAQGDAGVEVLKQLLSGQVYGKNGLFKKYLPGKTVRSVSTTPKSKKYIPELEQFHEAKRTAIKAFNSWAKDSEELKAAKTLFKQLLGDNPEIVVKDKEGTESIVKIQVPSFTLYTKKANLTIQYVKDNYEEVDREN